MASTRTPLPIPVSRRTFWARAYTDSIAWTMIHQQLRSHPLPWSVVHNGTIEVYASDGQFIAECMGEQEAADIVGIAEMIVEQLACSAA